MVDKSIIDVLEKKAKGYTISEVSEEFAVEEGVEKLIKRKVSEKHVAPDLSAIKLLLELKIAQPQELTAEQMEIEKARLLNLLKSCEDAPPF